MTFLRYSAVRFALVGAVNSAVGLSVIFLLKAIFDLGDLKSNAIGYAIGLGLGFVLNKTWTFGDVSEWKGAAARFVAAFLAAYVLNVVVVLTLIKALLVNSYVAQALGVVPYTVTFYALNRWWVFGRTGRKLAVTP